MVGMGDGTTAVGAVLSVIVVSMVLDRCAEGILEDFGQDIFHVDWDISFSFVIRELGREVRGRWEDGKWEMGTHAKVASVSPSITMDGAAPSVASQSSLTNEPHIRIILAGDNALSTIPTSSEFACSGFCTA